MASSNEAKIYEATSLFYLNGYSIKNSPIDISCYVNLKNDNIDSFEKFIQDDKNFTLNNYPESIFKKLEIEPEYKKENNIELYKIVNPKTGYCSITAYLDPNVHYYIIIVLTLKENDIIKYLDEFKQILSDIRGLNTKVIEK